MANFKIGEKVVCVDPIDELLKGEIYTVEGFNSYDGGLILKEVKSKVGRKGAFKKERFRKLDYDFAENLLTEISEAMKSETIKN